MGFMDKAKKFADSDKARQLASQAQAKLDEVQKGFNEKQSGGSGAAQGQTPVEYDQHGRPVVKEETPASADPAPDRPHGDPLVNDEPGSRHGTPPAAPATPPAPPSGGSGLSSGDPLAG